MVTHKHNIASLEHVEADPRSSSFRPRKDSVASAPSAHIFGLAPTQSLQSLLEASYRVAVRQGEQATSPNEPAASPALSYRDHV